MYSLSTEVATFPDMWTLKPSSTVPLKDLDKDDGGCYPSDSGMSLLSASVNVYFLIKWNDVCPSSGGLL